MNEGALRFSGPPDSLPAKLTAVLEVILLLASATAVLLWLMGMPLFYADGEPVLSVFTALSLLLLVIVRLARKFLFGWPTALSLALIGAVLGGNLSSMLMLTSMPPGLMRSFPDVVMTSVFTSLGLLLFCLYELLIVLRETPRSTFILDDILLHLALVPGGLSLLGYLFGNPLYLSVGEDPRVGISPLEMMFMGTYAVTAVLSNRQLFLWQFLAAGWINRLIFAALFANQFIAPVITAYAFSTGLESGGGPGIELFVLLAGVIATLTFLVIQAYLHTRSRESAPAPSRE